MNRAERLRRQNIRKRGRRAARHARWRRKHPPTMETRFVYPNGYDQPPESYQVPTRHPSLRPDGTKITTGQRWLRPDLKRGIRPERSGIEVLGRNKGAPYLGRASDR